MAQTAKWKWQASNVATLYLVLVACCLQAWQKITSECESVLRVHLTVAVRLTVHRQAANTITAPSKLYTRHRTHGMDSNANLVSTCQTASLRLLLVGMLLFIDLVMLIKAFKGDILYTFYTS